MKLTLKADPKTGIHDSILPRDGNKPHNQNYSSEAYFVINYITKEEKYMYNRRVDQHKD